MSRHPRRRLLRRSVTAALVASMLTVAATGTSSTGGAATDCAAPASQADATVASFDGTSIAVTVFRPDGACVDDPRGVVLTLHGWSGSRSTTPDAADVAPFVTDGYGVVSIDARGHGESGGQGLVHHPDREVRDFRAVLDWIHDELPWVAGDPDSTVAKDTIVGAYGGSYGGGFQLMTAAFDDRLDALVPIATWNSLPAALWPNRGAIKSDWLSLLYAAGESSATLDPRLRQWFVDGMARNFPPHGADDSFRMSSPAAWMEAIDVPALFVQGLPDTLFNLNQAVHNYVGIRDNGADVRLIGINGGHVLPGIQPTSIGHPAPDVESPCGDTQGIVLDFLDKHLRGDVAAAGRLAKAPRVMLATEQNGCVTGADWPIRNREVDVDLKALVAPEPGGSVLVPLLTAEEELTLAGIPRLEATPLQELDDQLYLSLVVADGEGMHMVDDQVTGIRIRGAPCHATITTRTSATCGAGAISTPRRIELGGIATTLQPGQELFLRVDGWNEQSAANSTRRPGAAVMTSVTITLPVISP
jgi:pimeloyl-ACP methyl ester carboxylesterase